MAPVPHGHWKTTTLVAGLRTTGITAPYVLDGAMTGATFRAYVEQILAPTLSTGDTVVMDNLPCHKVAGIREAIESVGAKLVYLPPYSPDSIPSSRLSPNSKRCSERQASVRAMDSGTPSPASCATTVRMSAATSSETPDMQPGRKML